MFLILVLLLSTFPQCHVDKLVFIDVAESSTKGGSTDLEIFSLPKVTVSAGEDLLQRLSSKQQTSPDLGLKIVHLLCKGLCVYVCGCVSVQFCHLYLIYFFSVLVIFVKSHQLSRT